MRFQRFFLRHGLPGRKRLDTCYLGYHTASRRFSQTGSRHTFPVRGTRSWIESEPLAVARLMIRGSELGCEARAPRQRQSSVFSKWPWPARGSKRSRCRCRSGNFEILAASSSSLAYMVEPDFGSGVRLGALSAITTGVPTFTSPKICVAESRFNRMQPCEAGRPGT